MGRAGDGDEQVVGIDPAVFDAGSANFTVYDGGGDPVDFEMPGLPF